MSMSSQQEPFLPATALHPTVNDEHEHIGNSHFRSSRIIARHLLGVCVAIALAVAVVYCLVERALLDEPLPTSRRHRPPNTVLPGPGDKPGASWSEEEALIVKAKLWQIYSWKVEKVHQIMFELYGPGWKNGPYEEVAAGTGRLMTTAVRLGFHGCFTERDGTGGCDGCLYSNALDRIYMDYVQQGDIPFEGGPDDGVPNFNNGMKPLADILEAIYTNTSFPEQSPPLPESLFLSGKSRADLWAFAALTATEYATKTNNMVCRNPDWEWPVSFPDGLESNSFWGKHCTQKEGTPGCEVNVDNRITFRTGRRDCKTTQMYQVMDTSTCPEKMEIFTDWECAAAGQEQGVEVQFADDVSEVAHCLNSDSDAALCHLGMSQKYNTIPGYYTVNPLHVNIYLNNCREELQIKDKDDCMKASEYMLLRFEEPEVYQVPLEYGGCFVFTNYEYGGKIRQVVHFVDPAEYPPPPPDIDLRQRMRFLCRVPDQKVQGYMAEVPGKEPGNQMDGEQTVTYFRDYFGLNGRETVALMGAHTVGRFHSRASLFRYIWIRNGGQLFNNEYYRNMANVPGYRFSDGYSGLGCTKVGDAEGNPAIGVWKAESRGEMKNVGPVFWTLFRKICLTDCRVLSDDDKAANPCCQDLPEGHTCNPSCVDFNSEGGNHEVMLPSEIGLFYKFQVNSTNGMPYGCPGLQNFQNPACNWFSGSNCNDGFTAVGCPLNDAPAAAGMKMHEVVELYAHNQDLWIHDFHEVMEKVIQNGYDNSELTEAPDTTTDVVCPYQNIDANLQRWVCFSTQELSAPFLISSEDGRYFQLNELTGAFEVGPAPSDTIPPNQKWYWAQTAWGQQLVNGLYHFGVGNLYYDETSRYLQNDKGMLSLGYSGNGVTYYDHFDTTPWMQRLYQWTVHPAKGRHCQCPEGRCWQGLACADLCRGKFCKFSSSSGGCHSRRTEGTCRVFGCDSSRNAKCQDGVCVCSRGTCPRNGACISTDSKGPSCDEGSDTGGTCRFFGCDSSRNSKCEAGHCVCEEGTCQSNGICVSTASRAQTTASEPSDRTAPYFVVAVSVASGALASVMVLLYLSSRRSNPESLLAHEK